MTNFESFDSLMARQPLPVREAVERRYQELRDAMKSVSHDELCRRQEWLTTQVCEARNQWSQQFEERWLHDDDVPDMDNYIGLWIAERLDATPPSPAESAEPVYTLAMIEDAWNVSVPLLGDYCERFKTAIVEMSQVSDVPMIGNPLMVGLRDPIICDDASLEVALREIAAERESAAPSGVSDADALLSAMGLDPERFRTEAGFINHRKVMAAIKHPADYAGLYAGANSGEDAWAHVSMTHLAASLRRRGDEVSIDAASWLETFVRRLATPPSPAESAEQWDRENLGIIVRDEWMAWAREQPNIKTSWLTPWTLLTEPEREVDRRIGERIARCVAVTLKRQAASAAPSGVSDAMVDSAARALCQRFAAECGGDAPDAWAKLSQHFKDDARAALEASQPQPGRVEGWIPVGEQLPEGYAQVLLVDSGAQRFVGYHQPHVGGTDGRKANTWWAIADDDDRELTAITHWQPLPASPAGGAK